LTRRYVNQISSDLLRVDRLGTLPPVVGFRSPAVGCKVMLELH